MGRFFTVGWGFLVLSPAFADVSFKEYFPMQCQSALLAKKSVQEGLTPQSIARFVEFLESIPEVQVLKRLSAQHEVPIYFFGGTSATLFDYWYSHESLGVHLPKQSSLVKILNVYQDIDVVIDSNNQNLAEAIAHELRANCEIYRNDGTSAWEVRLLRKDLADKAAVLSADFLNAHNDSLSTGLIRLDDLEDDVLRLTDARNHGNDLQNWKDGLPLFVKEITDENIDFIYSSRHLETARAREGKNPPFLESIRFLSKLFQFGFKLTPENEKLISFIARNTTMEDLTRDPYVMRWLSWALLKMFAMGKNSDSMHRVLMRTGAMNLILNVIWAGLSLEDKVHAENYLELQRLYREHVLRDLRESL